MKVGNFKVKHSPSIYFNLYFVYEGVLGSDLTIPQEKINLNTLQSFISSSFKYFFFEKENLYEISRRCQVSGDHYLRSTQAEPGKGFWKIYDKNNVEDMIPEMDFALCYYPTLQEALENKYFWQRTNVIIDVTDWYKHVEHLMEPVVFFDLLKQMYWGQEEQEEGGYYIPYHWLGSNITFVTKQCLLPSVFGLKSYEEDFSDAWRPEYIQLWEEEFNFPFRMNPYVSKDVNLVVHGELPKDISLFPKLLFQFRLLDQKKVFSGRV